VYFLLYFLAFFIYSVVGWIIEVIFVRIFTKKWTNRGFLIGPYCPIYGVAALTMHFLLHPYAHDLFIIFILAALLITTIEYITSYLLEKIFKTRWWDYSQLLFNIDGRVCLPHALMFGTLGVIFIAYIDPFSMNLLNNLSSLTIAIAAIIALIIFSIDLIISLKVISKVTQTAEALKKDNTSEINEKVKETLLNQSYLTRRLVNAFPYLKTPIKYTHKQFKRAHGKISNTVNNFKNGDNND